MLALVLLAQPAAAHAVLVDSEPATGATVAPAPDAVRLRFSEDVSAAFSSARLVDQGGRSVEGARLVTRGGDPRLLTVQLPRLGDGAYGVVWQVLAEDDGHTTSGVVVLNVGGPGPAPAISAPTDGKATLLDVARRWLGLCLLAGVTGGVAMAGLVLGRARSSQACGALAVAVRAARRRVLTVARACAALAAVVGVADLVEETRRLAPTAPDGAAATVVQLLGTTRWGHLWLVDEAALLALVAIVGRLRSSSGLPPRRPRLLGAGAGMLVLVLASVEALGSHAAAAGGARGVAVVAAALHVLAACFWLGALAALVVTLWPRGQAAAGRGAMIRACRGPFSRLALASALTVTVTGLYAAGRQVTYVEGLTATSYGRTLLVKSALVALLLGFGPVNAARMHRLRPQWLGPARRLLSRPPPARRLVLAEAGVGVLVLLAGGVLLETVPARGPVKLPARAATPAVRSGGGSVADLVVSVSVTPNRPGVNGFTVLAASSRRPPPAPVDGVALELDQAGDATGVTLREIAPGRYFGTGLLAETDSLRLAPLRLSVVVRRAGERVSVPIPWSLSQPVPPQPPAPGPRLAPYADVMALSLLGGALAAGVGWRRIARRRRPRPEKISPPKSPESLSERVLEGLR